jgi:hypothetical protein
MTDFFCGDSRDKGAGMKASATRRKAGNAPMRSKRSSKLRRVDKDGKPLQIEHKIRVTGIPNVGDTGEFKTRTILEQCVGRVFPIRSLQKDWVELHLGRFVGKRSWEESIWVESEFVELVKEKLRGKKSSRRKLKSR